jgi:hypothetical protein
MADVASFYRSLTGARRRASGEALEAISSVEERSRARATHVAQTTRAIRNCREQRR